MLTILLSKRPSLGLVCFSLVLALSSALPLAAQTPVVTLDTGAVQGLEATGVHCYTGIPYAQAPVGALRWRAPTPATPWTDVLDASVFGPACPQDGAMAQSEDCLTINVWRPAQPRDATLPVMVWIHGGALARGESAIYPGEALAAQGVVVVSMNYRLGRLGFFAHPDLTAEAGNGATGNFGYLDQLLALQWVQKNIAAFGGDPARVMIFGESAGGGSVLAHLSSPMSAGLFRAAAAQSPGVPSGRAGVLPLMPLAKAEAIGVDYVASLGLEAGPGGVMEALRALPVTTLLEGASGDSVIAALGTGEVIPGMPLSILDGRFLPLSPEEAFAAGRWNEVPFLVGANSQDLPVGTAATKDDLFAQFGALADEAQQTYDPAGDLTLDVLRTQAFGDRTLVEPARHIASLAASGDQPTWLYRFAYVPTALRGQPGWDGVPHGMEIPFVLGVPQVVFGDATSDADRAIAAQTSAYWVNFAVNLDPNGEGLPPWTQHDPATDRLLIFGNDAIAEGPDPFRDRLDLWRRVEEEAR